MSKNVISASIVAAALVLWLSSGAFIEDTDSSSRSGLSGQGQAIFDADERTLSKVRVAVISSESRTRHVVLRGRTESKRVVEVKAEIAGQVVSRPVERGTHVTRGQLLCEVALDDRQVAVEEARAGFEKARIEHAGSLTLAKQELLSEVAIAASQAREEAARAHLHRQMLNLERTRITAPFDGVVEDLHLNAGDYAVPGAACATLIDLDPMLVVAHVTEEEVANLNPGRPVSGSTRSGRELQGRMSFVGRQSDPVTRTYPVEITVENGDYSLRSGMTVSFRAGLDEVQAHQISPSLLTLGDNGDMGIRTMDAANRVVFNRVEILEDGPEGLWITGLPGTVNLITVGQEYVSAGEIVEPIYISEAADQIARR
jgi:multidrug efflux system membrane fusion protein